jgi:pimeloyl-ACP methyl ester carboxylesterase
VHGNGFCKELWLPTVDDVTKRLRATGDVRLEFVALDLPNHGDSAAIEFPLDWYMHVCRACVCVRACVSKVMHIRWKFGKVVAEVVQKLGYRQGQQRRDTLIGLGHSLGAAALLMAQARFTLSPHPSPIALRLAYVRALIAASLVLSRSCNRAPLTRRW